MLNPLHERRPSVYDLGARFSELLCLVTVSTAQLEECWASHKHQLLDSIYLLGTEMPPQHVKTPRLETILTTGYYPYEISSIIDRRKRILESTIWSKTSLAWTEYYAGFPHDPFESFIDLLDTRQRLKRLENRDTLVTSAAVGWATSLRKRHEEASQILLDTEHKLERVRGPTHFETLYCRVARAQAELEMSKQYRRAPEQPSHDGNDDAREAERLRLTRLSDEKGNLGVALLESVIPHLPPGEPERAEVESMVAWAYYWMGSSERGATMQERAFAVQLDKLGADHPETFVSFVELGFRYLELDRNREAAGMFDRALQGPIITETPGDKEY